MKIIGLTGGIATGKTTVSREFSSFGIPIIDADLIARQVVSPGLPALKKIISEFGSSILEKDGSLNRAKLASIIFSSDNARKRLNRCTHFYIKLEILKQVLNAFLTFQSLVFLDIPLLFESGLDQWVHSTIVVYCPEQIQKERLMRRDHLTDTQAEERMKSQMSIELKRSKATVVIDNSEDIQSTKQQTRNLVVKLKPNLFWRVISLLFLWLPCFVIWIGIFSYSKLLNLF